MVSHSQKGYAPIGFRDAKRRALEALVGALAVPVVASGGVSTIDQLVRLARLGCEGAIVGKALYEGALDLPEALAAVRAEAAMPPETRC